MKFLVHIPKTAGTSLRTAAEVRFGKARVLCDYGPDSAKTSESVLSTVIKPGNPENIVAIAKEARALIIAGHVNLAKYGKIAGLPNTAVFFREPVTQVISHFQHAVRHNGFEGTLLEFIRIPELQNLQTRYINGMDPALIGVVGITELFKPSLQLLNMRWGWNLPHRRRNVHNRFGLKRLVKSETDRREIEQLNELDRLTYRRAKQVYSNSYRFLKYSQTCDVRGGFTKTLSEHGIEGWACDLFAESPIEIEIQVNDTPLCRVSPDSPLTEFVDWKLPRDGQIGFRVECDKLPSGSEIKMIDSRHRVTLDKRKIK